MTVSGLGSVVTDLAASQRRWDDAAERVVRAGTGEDEDFTAAVTGMLTARRGYEASLVVARSRDRMLGTLIDMLA
jgi:hypothetical protein